MKLLVLLLCATAVLGKHELYEGWKSYYVGPASADKIKAFYEATQNLVDLDVLGRPLVQRAGLVLVSPQEHEVFTKIVEDLEIPHKLHRNDVKEALDFDDMNIEKHRLNPARLGSKNLPYDNYQTLDAIYEYMEDIAQRYPDKVTLVEPARTFQGRAIKYLKISTTNFEDESKPVIFIDGGIHSREWISPPTVTWAIHKLVEDVTEPDLLENFDWILHPVANPDGYVFTFTNNRFWRKTRSTDQHILSPSCPGVDGNRNYDFAWNTVGTSPSPCTDTYAGNRAFSEIETRVVRDILQEYLNRMALYITVHSFGSMILYPWGHDGTLSNNALALHLVGIDMAREIDALSLDNFPNYIVGNSALVLNYAAAGASEDYAHSIGVPLTYTYELPGLDFGLNGFVLNPIYIEPVCRETWAGFVVGARRAGELFEGIIVP